MYNTRRRQTKCNVLTRAARKKAGLPPPTPLFKGIPKPIKTETDESLRSPSCLSGVTTRQSTILQHSKLTQNQIGQPAETNHHHHGDHTQAATNESTSSSSDDDDACVGKPLWVQCDVMSCRKWRRWPEGTKLDHSKQWVCSMHPDPAYQSCDIPEETWQKPKKRTFTFNKLNSGQLVWAKMNGFCPWPAVVSPDPWCDNTYISVESEGCIYHVEFLGTPRSHIWLPEERIEPYYNSTSCQVGKLPTQKSRNKGFEVALKEAEDYLSLTNRQRLKQCVYDESCLVGDSTVSNDTSRCRTRTRVGRSSQRASLKVKTERPDDKELISHKSQASRNSRQRAASQLPCFSATSEQAKLFETLGIDFSGANLINALANSCVQRLQSQLTAALQNCIKQQTNKLPHVSLTTQPAHKLQEPGIPSASPPPARSVSSLRCDPETKEEHGIKMTPGPLSILPYSKTDQPNKISMVSNIGAPLSTTTSVGGPGKRLTQCSLEIQGTNGASKSVVLTTGTASPGMSSARETLGGPGRGRKRKMATVRRRQRSPKVDSNVIRKRRYRGRKKSVSPLQIKSPTIMDYFSISPTSDSMDANTTKQPDMTSGVSTDNVCTQEVSSQDQCVPDTIDDNLEWEIQNELQEIEDMLSTIKNTPVNSQSTSSTSGKTMADSGTVLSPSGSLWSSDGSTLTNNGLTLPVDGKPLSTNASGLHCNTATDQTGESNLESVMTELQSIENLIQDLSSGQVVPY